MEYLWEDIFDTMCNYKMYFDFNLIIVMSMEFSFI